MSCSTTCYYLLLPATTARFSPASNCLLLLANPICYYLLLPATTCYSYLCILLELVQGEQRPCAAELLSKNVFSLADDTVQRRQVVIDAHLPLNYRFTIHYPLLAN